MGKYSRIALLLVADIICINLAYIASFLLRFEFNVDNEVFLGFISVYANNIFILTGVKLLVFWIMGLYSSLWKYAGAEELVKIVIAAIGATAFSVTYLALTQQHLPRSIYIISCLIDIILIGGVRMGYRTLRDLKNPGTFNSIVQKIANKGLFNNDIVRVMVVGAGDAGATIIKEIKQHPEFGKKVVVAIDDDPNKLKHRLSGVKIAGNHSDIKQMARRYAVDEIIIAIPSAGKKAIQNIVNECNKTRCKLKILPGLSDLINEKVSVSKLRDVDIEDLLGRDPVKINLREISGYLEGKIVLVTGVGSRG
jgi:FlaA1/EpsC-like NDP-sugar epimerase